MCETDDLGAPDELRRAMVDKLQEMRAVRSSTVCEAFETVPRHLFAPGVPLQEAYSPQATLLTKRDEQGVAVSTVSAAHIQAMMLEQADLEPGMRVLEVGSGGYHAALIAEMVGEAGQVTTVDIDAEVVERARDCLAAAGYGSRVQVVLGDAEAGVTERAPYDRIIVTVGAWDIPPAWADQLAEGGRIVVPLRIRGMTRSVVFEPDDDRLVALGYELCSFVPMQGTGTHAGQVISLDGEGVTLRLEDWQAGDADLISGVLTRPRVEAWSGVTAGGKDRFDGLHLWLAIRAPNFGVLTAPREAVDRGVVAHAWPLGIPALVEGGSLAYLGLRHLTEDKMTCEFGAYGHGPDSEELVAQVVDHIRSWDGTSLGARIVAYPAGTPNDELIEGGLVLDKKHTRVVIAWPVGSPADREVPAT